MKWWPEVGVATINADNRYSLMYYVCGYFVRSCLVFCRKLQKLLERQDKANNLIMNFKSAIVKFYGCLHIYQGSKNYNADIKDVNVLEKKLAEVQLEWDTYGFP